MKRTLLAAGLIAMLGMVGACSQQAPEQAVDPVEQAWSDLGDAYNNAETAQEKAELIEGFVRAFPDTAQAGQLASAVAYYRGDELGEPRAAYDLLAETLAKNTDPEARYQIGTAMFPLAVELGEPMDLGAIADELAETRPLDFGEMIDIADLAIEHDQWELAASYAEAALEKATPEAFLADYPDDDFTPEEAQAKADRRKAMSLADLGWAQWNLGDTEAAVATFDRAEQYKTVDYLGVADTPIDLYRGKALLDSGDAEAAIVVLTPPAVLGSDEDAMAALREAYAAVNADTSGFEDFVWDQRRLLAREIDDFSLADYEGQSHDFSALSDGKVTLLAFWFPT